METRQNPDLLKTKVKGGALVQKLNQKKSMVPWKEQVLWKQTDLHSNPSSTARSSGISLFYEPPFSS